MTPEQILATRKSLDLTQKAFGDLVGVCADSVRFWEAGRRKPSKAALKLIKMEGKG